MCGIVGYAGQSGNAKEIIIDGLKRLEYRGYDSSGIALISNGKLEVRKRAGRIANLEEMIKDESLNSKMGIGHTRWATHGAPSDINSHPHTNKDGSIAVVHNGILENYVELRQWLIEEHGIEFRSEVDTEVIVHLISIYYDGNLEDAVFKALQRMRGAYAIAAVCQDDPEKIVAFRRNAPLIAGIGRGCNFIASDIPAILRYVKEIYLIENNEMVIVTKDDIKIYDIDRNEVHRDIFHVTWDAESAEKNGYKHFMLKEIHEQPKGLYETLRRRIDDNGMINLDGICLTKEQLENFNRIYIVACGTAYHAGLVGKFAIEKMAQIAVEVEVASEFRYRDPFVDDKTLFIAISQSGETSDTLEALREAKRKGARIISVVNVVGSSVARESDDVFYTWAGPEIAVASTKAYTTQLMSMYIIALYMGITKGTIDKEYYESFMEDLKEIPDKAKKVLQLESMLASLARDLYKNEQIFFIGRGPDAGVSYEGSLKLKEISYINSFAIAAGELKHGTIALIEKDIVVIALATQDKLYEKMLSNIQEVKARGAYVIGMATENNKEIEMQADKVIYIPECRDELTPLLSVIPLQLLAYYIAKERGCDIDKPKNLAKSVTVE
ncbi:MAG: glutamine--fructose-6-phosphate transaminase (isomerizing) [Eubacteriales bacterium]|nr:glutamine--fructose-6-phosphate transaminase (isomerizing) [Eubacteriales bacterium]MDD4389589.1 glutamine--fructose-6-phosphate transaminase (isomerizing) [Eubacteriales bacterium]